MAQSQDWPRILDTSPPGSKATGKVVQVSASSLGLIGNAGSSFSKTLWPFSARYMMEGSMDFVVDLLKV